MGEEKKLSPEEQLLRLIEEPSDKSPSELSGAETMVPHKPEAGASSGVSGRFKAISAALTHSLKTVFQGKRGFKTLNQMLAVAMICAGTYLAYDVMTVSDMEPINIEVVDLASGGVQVIEPPALADILPIIKMRNNFFAEVKPPEPDVDKTPTKKNDTPRIVKGPKKIPPSSLEKLAKYFHVTGILRPVQGTPMVVINVQHPKRQHIYDLKLRESIDDIENENTITVKAIEKDFIVITDGHNEKKLNIESK
ncbi:MAG: hypothetical protein KAS70_06520 [Planctomycetes bacterium]|nr:hypothetical protein [Planctomycetota bacterium]